MDKEIVLEIRNSIDEVWNIYLCVEDATTEKHIKGAMSIANGIMAGVLSDIESAIKMAE